MNVEIPLTGPQREFALCPDPHPAIIGGLGSGKSEGGIVRLVLLMIENYIETKTPCNTLMAQPTYDLLKLRSMPGVEDFLERVGLSYTINKSDYYIDIHPFGRMLFRSYDKPERIVSFEVAHTIADELDTLSKEKAKLVWRKLSERTRQKSHRKNSIGCVTTPDQGYSGFVYEKWVKLRQDGYRLIKAPTSTNPYLPENYIEQIRANYDPVLADMYLMGEFVSLSQNKVYHFFDRKRHHTDRIIQPNDTLHIGLDFNIGGCCATVWIVDGKMPKAVDEFVSHDTYDFVNNLSLYQGHRIIVFPDASGKSGSTNATATDIEIINNSRLAYVDAPNANPAIRDRINCFNALLAHDNIQINCEKCPELANALEQQGYDKKGNPEKFDAHPAIDDWIDGAGYFIHRRYPINRPSTSAPFIF